MSVDGEGSSEFVMQGTYDAQSRLVSLKFSFPRYPLDPSRTNVRREQKQFPVDIDVFLRIVVTHLKTIPYINMLIDMRYFFFILQCQRYTFKYDVVIRDI